MSLLPFGDLAPYKPRVFVPSDLNLGDWNVIAPVFTQLEERLADCDSVTDLEGWLLEVNELSAALDEEGSKRYIAMTCHTSSEEAKKRILALSRMLNRG